MPNDPLRTFRKVEPANWGFGASATISSQPFVLYHVRQLVALGTGGAAATNVAPTWPTLTTTRFLPWTARLADACYPVAVPNAYDRVYIHPVFTLDTDDTAGLANVTITAPTTTYIPGIIMPFGLVPESRNYSTSGKLNPVDGTRFPEDLIAAASAGTATVPANFNTRTNGHWMHLAPYASSFATNNGIKAVGSDTNPTHYGRAANSGGVVTGTGYQLPNDFTISTATTSALTATGTTGAAAAATQVIFGQGVEFATSGTEELVVSLGSNPAGVLFNHPNTAGKSYYANYFLMGVFLG